MENPTDGKPVGARQLLLRVPSHFPSDEVVQLTEWLVPVGERLECGTAIASFEGAKSSLDALAPVSGVLLQQIGNRTFHPTDVFAIVAAENHNGANHSEVACLAAAHGSASEPLSKSDYQLRLATALANHNSKSAVSRIRKRFPERALQLALESLKLRRMISIPEYLAWQSAQILNRYPALNAKVIQDQWIGYTKVNLGYVVDVGGSMMVPVIMNAAALGLEAFLDQLQESVLDCARCELTPQRCMNGTFTVSNLFSAGVHSFDPILNVDQTATLGIASAVDGNFEVSLSYDHRIVSGQTGARFLTDLQTACVHIQETCGSTHGNR